MDKLKRQQAEHDAIVKEKDERIRQLEEELSQRRPFDEILERSLCRACGKSFEEREEEEEKKQSATLERDDVIKGLEDLKKKLRGTESKLTHTELEKSLVELQLITQTSKIRRDLSREVEGVKEAARQAAARHTRELSAAQAEARRAKEQVKATEERKLRDQLAAMEIEVKELKAGHDRRDEQIEFLMQVTRVVMHECAHAQRVGSHNDAHVRTDIAQRTSCLLMMSYATRSCASLNTTHTGAGPRRFRSM